MTSTLSFIVHVCEADGTNADYEIAASLTSATIRPNTVPEMVSYALVAIKQASDNIRPGGRMTGLSIVEDGKPLPFVVFMQDEQGQSLRRTVVAQTAIGAAATVLIEQMSAIYDPVEDFAGFSDNVMRCQILACHVAACFSRSLAEALGGAAEAINRLTSTITTSIVRPDALPAHPARQSQ